MRTITRMLSLLAVLLVQAMPAWAAKAAPVQPWMMADWNNPAPYLADAGISARELGPAIGRRVLMFPHAERDIVIPSAKGPRSYPRARFISAVARVDLPAATLRRRLQDIAGYKSLFPLMPESEVVSMDGPNQLARFRIEVPLPALATFTVDVRTKQRFEADGSLSVLLVDGKAESLIAMLGGMTDELADQPVVGRWEFLPLNEKQSLAVFTYWDRLELKSFFARKLLEAYPELRVVNLYLFPMLAVEPVRRTFSTLPPQPGETRPQGMQSLERLRGLIERLSANGHVAVMEPEAAAAPAGKPKTLRYVSVATRMGAPAASVRTLATQYERLPEVLKELDDVGVKERGQQVDLDLTVKFALLIIRFAIDLDVTNTWMAPNRLEFVRTAGELAQLRGASEWHGLPGSADSLMLISVAHEVGEEAPLVLRLVSRMSTHLPYIDQAGSLIVQLVVMERMKPWVEKNAAAARVAGTNAKKEVVHE
ncbi:MAG: hypothetical protein K0R03_2694 [Moraxellaceae bacterium]|nr:hypothetical protein [Moraxellaceae bacterium]